MVLRSRAHMRPSGQGINTMDSTATIEIDIGLHVRIPLRPILAVLMQDPRALGLPEILAGAHTWDSFHKRSLCSELHVRVRRMSGGAAHFLPTSGHQREVLADCHRRAGNSPGGAAC